MKQNNIILGKVKITPIFEVDAGKIIQEIIPLASAKNILNIEWLQPHYADKSGNLLAQVQSFVIEVGGKTILIDTCVGNGKERPEWPEWNNLRTKFLQNLRMSGYESELIDVIICTHLHYDHVGWNTIQAQDKWVPTFPNARHLIVEDEFKYWADKPKNETQDDKNGINDSVIPIIEAGLADFVPDNHKVTDEISFIPTPGHTPHHVSVLIQSQGQSAVITGDILHHPCQIAYPEWMSFDTDEKQALTTRIEFLERFADTNTLILGTHFASPSFGRIARKGKGFQFIV